MLKDSTQSPRSAWWKTDWHTCWSTDLRSLAVMRMGLGLLVMADVIIRCKFLGEHYTDDGVLPRYALLEKFASAYHWSFHVMNGKIWFQAFLFGVEFVFGFLLFLGYRTRLLTLLCWMMVISVQNRNAAVLQAGDVLFRMMLLLSLFLPLGARFSIDEALRKTKTHVSNLFRSPAVTGIAIQVLAVYFFVVVQRTGKEWWSERSALYYALNLDQYTSAFGKWLLNFPDLLSWSTIATSVVEAVVPFLVLLPWANGFLRLVMVVLLLGLHLGIDAVMDIGLFPYVSCVSLFLFIPKALWQTLDQKLSYLRPEAVTIFYDGDCGFCKKSVLLLNTFCLLGRAKVLQAQDEKEIDKLMKQEHSWVVLDAEGEKHTRYAGFLAILSASPLFFFMRPIFALSPIMKVGARVYGWVSHHREFTGKATSWMTYRDPRMFLSIKWTWIPVVIGLYILAWNARPIWNLSWELPQKANWPAYVFRMDQRWNLFAPYPIKNDGWYVIPGKLRNGKEVDLFRDGRPVSWEKPLYIRAEYRGQRRQKYMMQLWLKKQKKYRLHFGKFVCRRWNRAHRGEETLQTFEIFFMKERTHLDRIADPEKKRVWRHDCFKKPKT